MKAATDKDGHLLNLADWSPELAEQLAGAEGISLGADHWEIIHLLREFYSRYQLAPAMRPFVKFIARELGPDKGRSIYLMALFPPSPARVCCKIAGLPRPENCL